MKRFLLSTAALVTLSAPLAAADLTLRYPAKTMPPAIFSWSGFYLGGNVGYAGDDFSSDALVYDASARTTPGADLDTAVITASNFIAGRQIGDNDVLLDQEGVGLEVSLRRSGAEGRMGANVLDATGVLLAAGDLGTSIDYFGTLRARAGYMLDRFLPDIAGGGAYGRTKTSGSASKPVASDNWHWSVGGGAFAVSDHWTVKAEYLYVSLGSADVVVYGPLTGPVASDSVESLRHSMKAGVSRRL